MERAERSAAALCRKARETKREGPRTRALQAEIAAQSGGFPVRLRHRHLLSHAA